MHPRINKWTAVERIGRSRGIDESGILAIGDGENDIPMIRNAGIGVVMGMRRKTLRSWWTGNAFIWPPGSRRRDFPQRCGNTFWSRIVSKFTRGNFSTFRKVRWAG